VTDTTLTLIAHAGTHVGKVRSGNEDAYHCGERLFVVADGLGGHAAGEVASALAVEELAGLEPRDFSTVEEVQEALAEAIRAGNRRVHAEAEADARRAGMGTTLTAAAVMGERLALAHVGDSRAYLLRGGALQQLTTDHTAAQEAVDAGYLTPEQAATRPERHMLARAVGLALDVAVDTPEPVGLAPGDRVLLCSDGLVDPLTDQAIATILEEHPDPREACEGLVQAALDGGGPDNVTVVVVRIDGS